MNIFNITPTTIPVHNIRYYSVPALQKSVHEFAGHGMNHASNGWSMKIDPTWTQQQIDVYIQAYVAEKDRK